VRQLPARSTARPEPARRSRAGVVAVIIDGIVVNIVAGLTQRKQALHDMIAGTLVVNEH